MAGGTRDSGEGMTALGDSREVGRRQDDGDNSRRRVTDKKDQLSIEGRRVADGGGEQGRRVTNVDVVWVRVENKGDDARGAYRGVNHPTGDSGSVGRGYTSEGVGEIDVARVRLSP